jgi:saccharopine dehydrogenase-like NADP-dependent oxidoreductase
MEIVEWLVKSDFTVTSAGRTTGAVAFPPQVLRVTVDYNSIDSLRQAFAGQHAVVEAFNPNTAVYQEQIVQAALDAGVRHLVTPDFSCDTFNPYIDEVLIYEPKRMAQRVLERLVEGKDLRWTAIITGGFFDWGECTSLCRTCSERSSTS